MTNPLSPLSRGDSAGSQLIEFAKQRIMKGSGRKNRSSSRQRNRDGHCDFIDVEQGHRHERKERRKHRDSSRPSRSRERRMVVSQQHHVLPMKSPSHLGHQRPAISPFMLPTGSKLSPRADVWLMLSLSSVATLSSISMNSATEIRTMYENTALICSSLLFTTSTLVGCGFRYGPFRESWTRIPRTKFVFLRSSKETFVSVLSLCLSLVVTAIAMNPELYIGMGGNSVWNANAFFATWISLYSCFYLVGDLLTTPDQSGLVDSQSSSPKGLSYFDTTAKFWYMLLGSTIALVGVLFDFSTSVCAPPLNTSHVCERAFGAGLLSVFTMLLNLAALALYRVAILGEMKKSRLNAFNGASRAYKMSQRIGAAISFVVFVVQSAVVGIVSSSSGPGLETGSIFLTAWMSFCLSLYLFKMYMESFCIPYLPSLPRKSTHLPIAAKTFDDSFRTFRSSCTNATDPMDDSCIVTDDEQPKDTKPAFEQQYFCIEEQKLENAPSARHAMVQRVPSVPSTASRDAKTQSVNEPEEESVDESYYLQPAYMKSFETCDRSKRSQDPEAAEATFPSQDTSPMVFTRKQSDVSTLGIGSIMERGRVEREPVGLKSGSSYYGGIAPEEHAFVTMEQDDPSYISYPSVGMSHGVSAFLYSKSVPTKGCDEDEPKQEQETKFAPYVRRASYSSVPSLPTVQESSLEAGSKATSTPESVKPKARREKSNRRSITSKKSKSSTKASKSHSKNYKHKYEKRGSEGSSSLSDPKTVADKDFKPHQSFKISSSVSTASAADMSKDFSIVCDNSTVVTEITTDGFDEVYKVPTANPRAPPRLPNKNPLYNGSDTTTSSGSKPTPKLNAFNSSVDDLVASALQYARASRIQSNPALNASARTMSPGGPSISSFDWSVQSGYENMRSKREEKSQQIGKKTKSTRADSGNLKSSTKKNTTTKASNRRGSLQSMYSAANSGDNLSGLGVDFMC